MKNIAFIDLEVTQDTHRIVDIGAVRLDGTPFHENSIANLLLFFEGMGYLGGHNILKHDLLYLVPFLKKAGCQQLRIIDTLYLSPLLFPAKPYHRLLKDDKLQTDSLNNPLNDSLKALDLFLSELSAFDQLDKELKIIYYGLLHEVDEFKSFFYYQDYKPVIPADLSTFIFCRFAGEICEEVSLVDLITRHPIELAYCLALINCHDRYSITPPWILKNFPEVEQVMNRLRNTPCIESCSYCQRIFDIKKGLKKYFGYDSYRTYDGQPFQENAVQAAVEGKSILAIFPTGGGKSITFQVPALMSGEIVKGLTVVISPLQSLMKDQVDNLRKNSITDAVTINGLLDPVERANSFERVEDGSASILYISPESLRSRTIERLLLGRKIVRFVIDEAHCFSAWGQDFRVDYLYIGDFIRLLQQKKNLEQPIPVSCFTATAKQKVIEDIANYFKEKLDIRFEIFRSGNARKNLKYKVLKRGDKKEKYQNLREIIEEHQCPTIVYVSRTRTAADLATQLRRDNFSAKAFHGKMDVREKTENQNDFIAGHVQIMVATSAFGMGVDKKDVGLVVHFEISDSLENYVQEAGRAGRGEEINAKCYVLFNEEDLNKHFILLNQTRLHIKEIQQIWKSIKEIPRLRSTVSQSALEIARCAGWDDHVIDIETRVTTAISALEEAGYIRRGQNLPHVFADSILAKTAQEAIDRIRVSTRFEDSQKTDAIRIIKKLIATRSRQQTSNEVPESRVDYISDHLGIPRGEVIRIISLLREEKILADARDLTAYIKKGETGNHSLEIVRLYSLLDQFLLSRFTEEKTLFNLKELREQAEVVTGKSISPDKLKKLINFWSEKNWIKRVFGKDSRNLVYITRTTIASGTVFAQRLENRQILSDFIIRYLFEKIELADTSGQKEEVLVEFSVLELKDAYTKEIQVQLFGNEVRMEEVEEALFYLSRIGALLIEGGFLVLYNQLTINRLERNNKVQYKQEDYRKLEQFYANKIQQIHIVGEYARKMLEDDKNALKFVDDYFQLNYSSFLQQYFPGSRGEEINRRMTDVKYRQLFGDLSETQLQIVKDSQPGHIVVMAGPGSGKTRLLVHKLASLLMMEDVKHEQLLMLTFSRAAAGEFRKRLRDLVNNAAGFIEIKTFHSYCFDLLGRQGTLEKSASVVQDAVRMINSGEVEINRITKAVLVIDEAQDMTRDEFALVEALIARNEDLKVIVVGDDDQNIFGFRRSDSRYMKELVDRYDARMYELLVNYRSRNNLVEFTNCFVETIPERMKQSPVVSRYVENGEIRVVHYHSDEILVPAIYDVCNTPLSGTTCVLTQTNEEAMQVAYLLQEQQVPVRLIQSNDGFRLSDLDEIRYFNHQLGLCREIHLMGDERWEEAKSMLKDKYCEASSWDVCQNIITTFEDLYPRKYRSDWEVYLYESKLEDFYKVRGEIVVVSTIHKAKGKEFDNVFLLLSGNSVLTTERKREVYVAMTRAKGMLSVHFNSPDSSIIPHEECQFRMDTALYPAPDRLSFMLTHRDVWLGFFLSPHRQNWIENMKSGTSLQLTVEGCNDIFGHELARFSRNFKENTLQKWLDKGYKLKEARINFIVYWKNPEDSEEGRIILPEIVLER